MFYVMTKQVKSIRIWSLEQAPDNYKRKFSKDIRAKTRGWLVVVPQHLATSYPKELEELSSGEVNYAVCENGDICFIELEEEEVPDHLENDELDEADWPFVVDVLDREMEYQLRSWIPEHVEDLVGFIDRIEEVREKKHARK